MRFVFTCASASSHTSRGASEHSAAQSRKLERNPCGTAPILDPAHPYSEDQKQQQSKDAAAADQGIAGLAQSPDHRRFSGLVCPAVRTTLRLAGHFLPTVPAIRQSRQGVRSYPERTDANGTRMDPRRLLAADPAYASLSDRCRSVIFAFEDL